MAGAKSGHVCCGCNDPAELYDSVYGEYWCKMCFDILPQSDKEDAEIEVLEP